LQLRKPSLVGQRPDDHTDRPEESSDRSDSFLQL